jgi:hypothetical protein
MGRAVTKQEPRKNFRVLHMMTLPCGRRQVNFIKGQPEASQRPQYLNVSTCAGGSLRRCQKIGLTLNFHLPKH